MTCLAAIKHEDHVHLAADRHSHFENMLFHIASGKIIEKPGGLLIGSGGNHRLYELWDALEVDGALLREGTQAECERYLKTKMMEDFISLCSRFHVLELKENALSLCCATLFAHRAEIYKGDSMLSCTRTCDEFAAAGSGGELAQGALTATRFILPPPARLYLAMEAASIWMCTVSSEWDFRSTKESCCPSPEEMRKSISHAQKERK